MENNLADICASVQHSLIQMLAEKLEKAADQCNIKQIAIAGGVSANSGLRKRMQELANKKGWQVYIPKFDYCTDNAAMIAMAAHFMYQEGEFDGLSSSPNPRMRSFI